MIVLLPPPPPPRQVIRTILNLSSSKLLLLRPNLCFPHGESDAVHIYGSRRLKQAQYLAGNFWKRWTREYLPTLQVTQKWLRPRQNLSVGDLVLVIGENSPRSHWPKGVVQVVFPDCSGNGRQVTVRTTTTTA